MFAFWGHCCLFLVKNAVGLMACICLQVLNIVYFDTTTTAGGFFPNGISGWAQLFCLPGLWALCNIIDVLQFPEFSNLKLTVVCIAGNNDIINATGTPTTDACSGALSMASLSTMVPVLLTGVAVMCGLLW